MRTFSYPAVFEPGENPGIIVVTFPDVPEAITEGDGEADARAMGAEALGLMLVQMAVDGRRLPAPSRMEAGQRLVSADAGLAGKAAVLETFRDAGMTRLALAKQLGKDVEDVRRILDPDHATEIPVLAAALGALGRRLVIGIDAI